MTIQSKIHPLDDLIKEQNELEQKQKKERESRLQEQVLRFLPYFKDHQNRIKSLEDFQYERRIKILEEKMSSVVDFLLES